MVNPKMCIRTVFQIACDTGIHLTVNGQQPAAVVTVNVSVVYKNSTNRIPIERSWDLKSFSAGLNTLKGFSAVSANHKVREISSFRIAWSRPAGIDESFPHCKSKRMWSAVRYGRAHHQSIAVDVQCWWWWLYDFHFRWICFSRNLFAHKYFYNVTNATNYVSLFTQRNT